MLGSIGGFLLISTTGLGARPLAHPRALGVDAPVQKAIDASRGRGYTTRKVFVHGMQAAKK
jgi:hypothetical protein